MQKIHVGSPFMALAKSIGLSVQSVGMNRMVHTVDHSFN
jgi:hypothetical protein